MKGPTIMGSGVEESLSVLRGQLPGGVGWVEQKGGNEEPLCQEMVDQYLSTGPRLVTPEANTRFRTVRCSPSLCQVNPVSRSLNSRHELLR